MTWPLLAWRAPCTYKEPERNTLEPLLDWRIGEDKAAPERRVTFTPEEQQLLARAFDGGDEGEKLVYAFNMRLLRKDLQTLRQGEELNDEVINFWFELLRERSLHLCNGSGAGASAGPRRRDLFVNTYFMPKLMGGPGGYNYANVRRWMRPKLLSKKYGAVDSIFDFERVIIPVHVRNSHWCLAVVYINNRRIQYFDSLNDLGTEECNALLRWLDDESQLRLGRPLGGTGGEVGGWEVVPTQPGTPQQDNCFDCGVFTCTAADFCSALPVPASEGDVGTWMKYSQADMPHFRQRMACRILEGKGSLIREWERGALHALARVEQAYD